MNFDDLINSITPEIYERLKRAVELGNWDNGLPLTPEQREHNLQAIIAYDQKHKQPEDRVGYIEPKTAKVCSESNDDVDIVRVSDS